MPKRSISFVLFVFLMVVGAAQAEPAPTTRPVAAITHALVISIDGCRPDLLLRADTPNLHRVLDQSSYTFWAHTIAEAITLPSHTSMLTGVTAQRHHVTWNDDLPPGQPQLYPAYPTIFEVMKRAGYTTGMAAGKSKFVALDKPGTVDWAFIPRSKTIEDEEVAAHAAAIITEHRPEMMFVHLPGVDNAGHAYGWGSDKQRTAVTLADAAVGIVLGAVDQARLSGSTFVIITADHGGAGRTHGPNDARSLHIPWIAFGPGIRKNLDLTTDAKLTVNTEDTFATVCLVMGVKFDPAIDGKPIEEIIQRDDLLYVDPGKR
jgi:predicted AlkP superfamily pyrophosphatase or phosphodiesterase